MSKKFNILLDLDQTLISAEALEEYDAVKNKAKSEKFKSETMDEYYIVFERPGLQEFLTYLFDNFNVSIWTAASKDYALFIIDKFILNPTKLGRKLDWIFFSYHCDISKKIKKGSKMLDMMWNEYKIDGYNKDNTIILDDYDEVYKIQPNNCIIAFAFEFTDDDSDKDRFMYDLKEAMKEAMKKYKNSSRTFATLVNDTMKKTKGSTSKGSTPKGSTSKGSTPRS